MMHFLSVIIPTYKRPEMLALCLQNLERDKQTLAQEHYEVIVSDDAGMESKEVLEKRFPWVKWLSGPGKGPASNRNYGASNAKGDWLIFLDDDCLPAEEWLKSYFQAIGNFPEIKVLEGKVLAERPRQRFNEESPINSHGGFLWSCNFAITKECFFELGGFDEKFPFPAMEDVDFRLRVKESNTKFLFVPEALVVHPWRKIENMAVRKEQHFQSSLYFIEKHGSKKTGITPTMYLRAGITRFYYGFFPNLIKFKGRGWSTPFLESLFDVWFAIRLLWKKR